MVLPCWKLAFYLLSHNTLLVLTLFYIGLYGWLWWLTQGTYLRVSQPINQLCAHSPPSSGSIFGEVSCTRATTAGSIVWSWSHPEGWWSFLPYLQLHLHTGNTKSRSSSSPMGVSVSSGFHCSRPHNLQMECSWSQWWGTICIAPLHLPLGWCSWDRTWLSRFCKATIFASSLKNGCS